MKIIKPSVEIMTPIHGDEILKHLEVCGRLCYQSEDGICDGSADKLLSTIIKRGHEAVIEHYNISVRIVCDRGVTHEIVRHRLASYCQESTRYCNYSKDKFGKEITVIEPCYLEYDSPEYVIWESACRCAERAYFEMLAEGCTPQEARAVLPHSTKTEIIMTTNIREWRHFCRLRTAPEAHPQMREVACKILELFKANIPVLFDDI